MHRGENRYICFHQYRCLSTETRSVMFVSMRIFFHTSVTTGDSHPITTVLNLTRQSPLFQNVASCGDPGQTYRSILLSTPCMSQRATSQTVLRMRPQKPKPSLTASVARKRPLSAQRQWSPSKRSKYCSPSPQTGTSPYE